MQRRSPPQHRHDGTSPLPLGMDWSPPPRKWNGRHTQWPHDHRTGWSYCVTIPTWVVLPKSRDSDPIVFYRIQIGVQSPEGITTITTVLRRFNEFLKLFNDLKKLFPNKNIPPSPPKGLLRLKSRTLLDERKVSLEQWMTQLLSDLDLSRSVSVAAFLELEAAARSAFQDVNQQQPETTSSNTLLQTHGSSSLASECGSDSVYEASEHGRKDEVYDNGGEDFSLDEDLIKPIENILNYGMSNIDEGLSMGKTILDQLEVMPRSKPRMRYGDTDNGNTSKSAPQDLDSGWFPVHSRKLSSESYESDVSSLVSGPANLSDLNGYEAHSSGDGQILLPVEQKQKMNRILLFIQQRLTNAKTDMMDLISRLNQEIAVKDYLATKVKDLEVEVLSIKQKSKENLQQAIVIEREKLTRMQWDMEELRRKSLEMDMKLKPDSQKTSSLVDSKSEMSINEEDEARNELEDARKQLETMAKQYELLESKSKSEIKLLAKEFKSLKLSQAETKQQLTRLQGEKSDIQIQLEREKETRAMERRSFDKLLRDCRNLCHRLQESDLEDLDSSERANALEEFVKNGDSSSGDELRSLLQTAFLNSKLTRRLNSNTRNVVQDHRDLENV